jgi:hypothetical protein
MIRPAYPLFHHINNMWRKLKIMKCDVYIKNKSICHVDSLPRQTFLGTGKHMQTSYDEKTEATVGGNDNDLIPWIWCLSYCAVLLLLLLLLLSSVRPFLGGLTSD